MRSDAGRGARQIRQGRAATLATDGDRVTGVSSTAETIRLVLCSRQPGHGLLPSTRPGWAPSDTLGRRRQAERRTPSHVLEQAGIEAAIGGAVPDGDGIAYTPPVRPDARGAHDIEFSLVPRPGTSAVGSTFLAVEPDPTAWIEPILVRARRFVPAVADAPIREARTCARPQSVDGLPLIGAVPGLDGVFVCAGHGPWGVSTGPASARLVADLILGRHAAIPREVIEPHDAARIAGGGAPAATRPGSAALRPGQAVRSRVRKRQTERPQQATRRRRGDLADRDDPVDDRACGSS
jgi:glycine/D-amino acid oxidase-like deaminating enzyme